MLSNIYNNQLIQNQQVVIEWKEQELESELDRVIQAKPFQTWLTNMNKNAENMFCLHRLHITQVDYFSRNAVGFIKMRLVASPWDMPNVHIPGIILLRGDAVAILPILVEQETQLEHIVLTCQPRLPLGKYQNLEIPAGMVKIELLITNS